MRPAMPMNVPSPPSTRTRSQAVGRSSRLTSAGPAGDRRAPPSRSRTPRARRALRASPPVPQARRRPRRGDVSRSGPHVGCVPCQARALPRRVPQVQQDLPIAFHAGDRRIDRAGTAPILAHLPLPPRRRRPAAAPRRRARCRPCRPRRGPPRTAASPARRRRRPASSSAGTTGSTRRSEMNETSMVTMSKTGVGRQLIRRSACRALTCSMHDDPRIAAQLPVELSVADVERDDAAAPRCSSTSVKPPVEAPMSSAEAAGDVDARRRRAHAPASRRRGSRRDDPAARRVTSASAATPAPGLRQRLAVDADLAGQHQRARPLARRGEAALDEQHVEPCAGSSMGARDDPARDRGELAAEPGALRARRARGRRTARRAAAIRRGRRARDRSACRRRRPCRRSCRGRPTRPRRRGCRPRSGTPGRGSRRRRRPPRSCASSAPAMIAPASADAADQRAGLARVHGPQRRRGRAAFAPAPAACEIERPGRRPSRPRPAASATSATTRSAPVAAPASPPARGSRASSANASVSSASPARIAIASPKTTCEVGRPRRRRVVVHRRQVVVNERVGVNQLDRARGGHRQR